MLLADFSLSRSLARLSSRESMFVRLRNELSLVTFESADRGPYSDKGARKFELCSTICLPMLLRSAARSTACRGRNEKGCPETVYDTVIMQTRLISIEHDRIWKRQNGSVNGKESGRYISRGITGTVLRANDVTSKKLIRWTWKDIVQWLNQNEAEEH